MNARWAVLAGAGSVGAAWAGRTFAESLPPDVLSNLPFSAQVAVGIVAATLVLTLATCVIFAGLILVFGGRIQ